MGFFSFLTRKSSSDKNQNQIKGQSYKSTVASIPPIQGTYPVAGNGPNVLDQLQQAARKRSQAQLSVIDHDIDIDPAAPPPMVPRFRSFSPGRPTTAPNQAHANSFTSRPRSVARSIRSTNSAWSVPEKTRAAVRTVERPPPVPSIPSHHRRESSIDSFQDGNRFVDVLDAQGEIRPSNFRSRVAATGAREFGEDVAERNIGENGLNLNSPAVKAFYRLSSSGRLTLQTSDSGGLSVHDYDGFDEDDDDCAPPPGIPHLDLGTIRESSRPTSSSQAWRSFSGSIGGEMLRSSKSQRRLDKRPETSSQTAASLKNRRRSFNAFASAPEPQRSKPRPLSLHPSLSNFNYSAPLSPPPMPKSRPKTSEGRSRQRSIGMVEIESLVDEAFDTPAPCPTIPVRFKQEHPSYSRPDSHLSRQDLILPRHDPPIPRHDPLVPVPRHDSSHIRPDTHHGQPTLSLYPRSDISQPSRPSSSSSMDKPPRNRSIGGASVLRNQRLDNITEHIPVRTSSLTLKSQPCITPTTMSSGYSSNPFPRSQHTPSTSIDVSAPPSIKINREREHSGGMPNLGNQNNYYNAADDDFSADTLVPSRRELEQDLSHPINAGVEAEYYISDASEDSVDSFIAWKEEKRRGEEGLLYREDYGIAGGGLPGLFEPLPIPKAPAEPPAPIKPPKTPKSPKRPTTRGTTKSNKSTPKKTRHQQQHLRRSRTSTFSPPRREPRNGSSSDDEGSDSFWERARDMPHGPSFVSLAELGIDLKHLGLDQYGLTEEDDAKVDIHTAVKLRKEMRRRKMETTSRRHTRSYADEADVED
ncbi:hypothetical protein NCS52_01020000 [Fusarium sp. LHS14.1]|nr:hypothetical protein NCS52_01020000 [Fusarium sp. LHS14.1]